MKKRYFKCPDCGNMMTVDKSVTGKKAKAAGNYFERKVAKFFEKHTGLRWKKTPASGAFTIPGDIFCLDLTSQPFVVECKNREEIKLKSIFLNPERTLTDKKTKELLINDDQLLVFNEYGLLISITSLPFLAKRSLDKAEEIINVVTSFVLEGFLCYAFRLEDFLTTINWEVLKNDN